MFGKKPLKSSENLPKVIFYTRKELSNILFVFENKSEIIKPTSRTETYRDKELIKVDIHKEVVSVF